MDLGARIKEAAAKVGGQRKLSKTIGVSERALSDYVGNKSSPQLTTLEAIAQSTGVDLVWLVTGGGDTTTGAETQSDNQKGKMTSTVALPRYDIQASAGHGALAENETISNYLTVSREWLNRYVTNGADVVVIEARGDSMEPTVRDGDLLLVQMDIDTETVAAGGVFVITVGSMIMIKRLQVMLNGDLKIMSDNKAYEPETIPAAQRDESVIIHGRVFWCGGPLGVRG